MNQLLQLCRRLLLYLRRDQFDRELAEEMRFHLELKAEENLQAGMGPVEARFAAERQFGNRSSGHNSRSAAGHLLNVFGVPSPLHRDLRGGAFDLKEIVRRKFD